MFLRTWRLLTLLLAALNMAMAFAHLLQLPPRMSYSWKYSHAARAILMIAGFVALLYSVLVETPNAAPAGEQLSAAEPDRDQPLPITIDRGT